MISAAEEAVAAAGVPYRLVRHEGVPDVPREDLVKTLVVRRGPDDFLLVLVQVDRVISWPKLRALLGVNRMSMPDAAAAKDATGFERGTITPFGTSKPWPVIADARIAGRTVNLGAGVRGYGLQVAADAAVAALGGRFAEVTDGA